MAMPPTGYGYSRTCDSSIKMGAKTVSLRRNSQAPGLKTFYKIMKAQKILWLLFPSALAVAAAICFASCHDTAADDLQAGTETAAPTTGNGANTTGGNPPLTFRTCLCTEACPIDIVIVSGSPNLTICGVLNGTAGCTIATTSCTSTTYVGKSTTITASDCVCVPAGNIFRVTNNGLASVTIDIIVTGTMGPLTTTATIPANSFLDFEVNASEDCDVAVIEC
jgi:hypothetical protein